MNLHPIMPLRTLGTYPEWFIKTVVCLLSAEVTRSDVLVGVAIVTELEILWVF